MLNMDECNNNNYVPSYYPAGSRPVTSSSTSTLSQGFSSSPGITRHQATFTFTSPTQCYTLATPRPSIQSTSRISPSAPGLGAPGIGTSWQHSIPTTMPWVPGATQLPTVGLGNVRQFSGYHNHSTPVKRPKRKAFDEPNEAPCPKVYLCLDKFKNLHITQPHSHTNSNSHTEPSHAIVGGRERKAESWQHYNDLEQRLDEDLEEDSDPDPSGHQSGVIKVADGVLEVTTSPQALLPRDVMQRVQGPCMQLVLWQAPLAPGASIRDMLSPATQAPTSTSPSVHHMTPATSTDPLSDCVLPGGMCCWDAGGTRSTPSGTARSTPSPHVQHTVFSNNNNTGFSMFNNNNVFNNNNNDSSIDYPQDVFSLDLDGDQDMQL